MQVLSKKVQKILDSSGKLPAYAWPGGYPIVYVTGDSDTLCPNCAESHRQEYAAINAEDAPILISAEKIVDYFVHYEGAPVICDSMHIAPSDDCTEQVESAYGDPDMPEDETEE